MISTALARALRDSGLVWHPLVGDAFSIDRMEIGDDVFYLSNMTVEAHEFSSGTVLGFNGTTEWALDSLSLDEALWLPREDQVRALLRGTFRSLTATAEEHFVVACVIEGQDRSFEARVAVDAYAKALLALLDESLDDPFPDLDLELPTL